MKVYKYNGTKIALLDNSTPLCEFNNAITETHSFSLASYSVQFTARLFVYIGSLTSDVQVKISIDNIICTIQPLSIWNVGTSFYLGEISLANNQTLTVELTDDMNLEDWLSTRMHYEKTYLGD